MRSHALFAFALLCACKSDKTLDTKPDAQVLNVVAHDVSPPLRELAKLPRPFRAEREIEMEPARRIPLPHMKPASEVPADPVAQAEFGPAPIAPPSVSFEAQGAGMSGFTPGGVPPDTDGDIGPNEYVQVVNISLTIFDRAGAVKMGPMDTSMVWAGFNGACAQTNDGDGVVRYDHIADRWVISQFSLGSNFNGPFYQCVAVSTSPDPQGTYNRYQFNLSELNDYPKIALWPDAYYVTYNMFGNNFDGGKICALDRTKLLAGAADATQQCFDAGANYGGLLASDLDGKTLPPAGAPENVIALDANTAHAYWQLHVDFTTPTNSTFTGPQPITVASYSPACQGGTCIVEPTGGDQLDSLADRAMNRFVYRRFVDHESLLLSHSVTASTGTGIRWYEFRNPAAPTVFQQGTFAPDTSYRWMPSIAMDGAGNIATIYTVASSTIKPSIRYAARNANDPAGKLSQGEGTIATGAGVQSGVSRWGDYASLNIDPVDDCTFWGTHEYKKANGGSNWNTRVASFTLPSCASFALTGDAETVQQGASAMYTVNVATTAGSAQMVNLTAMNLPQGVTATFNPASVMSGGTTQVTVSADTTAALGATHYTVVGMGTASSTMTDIALTVEPPAAMPDAGNMGGGDDGGNKGGGCCETGGGGSPLGTTLLALGVVAAIGRRRRRA